MGRELRIIVTGASGFVGQSVCQTLRGGGLDVAELNRSSLGDIGRGTDWSPFIGGAGVIVHLAARVHQMNDRASDPLAAFREVNVHGTRRLIEQAAQNGVRRVVFVSSIKVNGEGTSPGQRYTEEDPPQPVDAYGVSKLEAEQVLREVSAVTGCEVVILRPPLMCGRE